MDEHESCKELERELSWEIEWLRAELAKLDKMVVEQEADLFAARKRFYAAEAEVADAKESLQKESATLGKFHCRVADALAYCRRHAHPGINLAAHTYLNRVIEILEGKECG